jgi:cysteine desulfurase
LFHVDAAQAVGKIAVDVEAMQADLLTIAGHKMYAPKGIGALYVRRGTPLQPLSYGASQEGGIRPGTENVAYIAGLGAAARLVSAAYAERERMASLRDELQEYLVNAISLPSGSARAVIAMLAEVVALSPGAACHAEASHAPSGVMQAIGATVQQANGAIRISLGFDTTSGDIDLAGRLIADAYARHVADAA